MVVTSSIDFSISGTMVRSTRTKMNVSMALPTAVAAVHMDEGKRVGVDEGEVGPAAVRERALPPCRHVGWRVVQHGRRLRRLHLALDAVAPHWVDSIVGKRRNTRLYSRTCTTMMVAVLELLAAAIVGRRPPPGAKVAASAVDSARRHIRSGGPHGWTF